MIRVRFHGRGGHGVKTASRILGTAAFRSGFQVQDSPIYGAERRGAPVTAFTRIDRAPILERGVITIPNLVVLADESLLSDRSAGVLVGAEQAVLFVNSPGASDCVPAKAITLDLTRLNRERFGKPSALSTVLAAAAARLIGVIGIEALHDAVREELEDLDASPKTVEVNLDLAGEVFSRLTPATLIECGPFEGSRVRRVGFEDPAVGSPCIVAAGNAVQRLTGSWRLERPVIDYDVCTRCRLCLLGCPEGAMALNAAGFPVIDYDHCKGCLLCARICPLHGIRRERELQAW